MECKTNGTTNENRAPVAYGGDEMKLVDILARELEAWAGNETHAAVVDWDG